MDGRKPPCAHGRPAKTPWPRSIGTGENTAVRHVGNPADHTLLLVRSKLANHPLQFLNLLPDAAGCASASSICIWNALTVSITLTAFALALSEAAWSEPRSVCD